MINNKNKFSVISLFSGCGGLDLGFAKNGFEILWAIDIDAQACETYRFNIGDHIECQDIVKLDANSLPEFDVLICGPPCQGFSTIGKRDENDKRNSLYLDALKVVETKKPKFVVLENVRGLLSFQKGRVFNSLVQKLENLGYFVEWDILNAKEFGLSQNRERIFVIANNINHKDIFKRIETHKAKTIPLKETIGDIEKLSDLPNHNVSKKWDSKYNDILIKIDQGQKLCDTRLGIRSVHTWQIPDVFGEITDKEERILYAIAKNRRLKKYRKQESWNDASPLSIDEIEEVAGFKVSLDAIDKLINKNYLKEKFPGLYDLKHTFNGKFRRLNYEKPSEAVLTNFGSPRNYVHPTCNRPLTARECARIQSFPDDFVFKGSISNLYKQIGNAVPPAISSMIAKEIKPFLQ